MITPMTELLTATSRITEVATDTSTAIHTSRSFSHVGLPGQAFTILQKALRNSPQDALLWRELLTYFLSQELFYSAHAISTQLEAGGVPELIPEAERALLKQYEARPAICLYIASSENAPHFEEALSAVFSQSYPASQILLVADPSDKAIADIATRSSSIEILRCELPRHPIAAIQTALRAARIDLFATLGAEVVPSQFWLERLLLSMVQQPVIGAFGPVAERHSQSLANHWRKQLSRPRFSEEHKDNQPIPDGSNALYITEALRRFYLTNTGPPASYDARELYKALQSAGFAIHFDKKALCQHARNDSMQSALQHRFLASVRQLEPSSPTHVMQRLQTTLRDGLREMESFHATNHNELLFPSFLHIIWSIAREIQNFLTPHLSPSDATWATELVAELRVLLESEIQPYPEIYDATILHLLPVIVSLPAEVQDKGWAVDPHVNLATNHLAKFRIMLDFPESIFEALLEGARSSLGQREILLQSAHRVAVVEVSFLLQWRSSRLSYPPIQLDKKLRASLAQFAVDVAVFDRTSLMTHEGELAAALRGYSPSEIILAAGGLNQDSIILAVLLLKEWLSELPTITVCGAADKEIGNFVNLVDGTISEVLLASVKRH